MFKVDNTLVERINALEQKLERMEDDIRNLKLAYNEIKEDIKTLDQVLTDVAKRVR